MSIISAVTRKRKKCLNTHLHGSSADEDSEHEPVKASNYRIEKGCKCEEKEEEDRGNEENIKREPMSTKKEKDEKEKGMKVRETTDGKDSLAAGSKICAAYPRPPTMTNNPSDIKPQTRGRPTIPFWIFPTRLPNLYQSSRIHRTPQAQWNKSTSVCYWKTKSGRTRALSMNLDLELQQIGPVSQIDQSSPESSTVVLRRLMVDTRDKKKAWHRHTVIV